MAGPWTWAENPVLTDHGPRFSSLCRLPGLSVSKLEWLTRQKRWKKENSGEKSGGLHHQNPWSLWFPYICHLCLETSSAQCQKEEVCENTENKVPGEGSSLLLSLLSVMAASTAGHQ